MKTIKKDSFFRDEDSISCVLEISCSACKEPILLYQKDDRGFLHRLYLNRILVPEYLADIQNTARSPKDLSALSCLCGNVIGVPMMHREGRVAFRLTNGSYRKRKIQKAHLTQRKK